MFLRLVRYAGHVCAVVTTTAMILVASVHASNQARSFRNVTGYGASFARHVVDTFDVAVIERIADYLPRQTSAAVPFTFDDALGEPEFVPPSIERVVVAPDGRATLSGEASPGVEIAIQSRGRSLGRTKVSSTGHWQVRLEQALEHGDHHMRSVAYTPGKGFRHPGEEIRIALPQTLTRPLVALGDASAGGESITTGSIETGSRHAQDTPIRPWQTAQADLGDDDDGTDNNERRRQHREEGFASPLFDWLRKSSIAYDRWIVEDLSGGDDGFRFVIRGRDVAPDDDQARSDRAERERDDVERRRLDRQFEERNFFGALGDRWQTLNVSVREWLRQAHRSYNDDIVEELSRGERVSRDRFVRAEKDQDLPQPSVRQDDQSEITDDDWSDWQPEEAPKRTADTTPKTPDPLSDWPVVREDDFEWPELPDVRPDPEKEALIKKAEEDAKKARELARKAAAQAEATRKATEALLAEEKRLKADWAARREAAKRAAAEAELSKRVEDAERQAAEADTKLKEAERLAAEREAQDQEARERAEAQRKTAEELAAAATAEADEKFAAGRVAKPPGEDDGDTTVAETESDEEPETATPSTQDFTVADTGSGPRLSIKDSASDALIEEGSTYGDVDDFDPSVRFIYDMGDGGIPYKAKNAEKRHTKKYRAKSHKAKRKRNYRKYTRKRRAYRSRNYRKRHAHTHRRARLNRKTRRIYRHARRFGRLYKFKAKRRRYYRRHAYARPIFIPRIQWGMW